MRTGLACLMLGGILLTSLKAQAQAPVTDLGNTAQNIVTAIEAVDQSLTMVLQYQNQLAQYEELVRNGLAPAVYTWDRLNSINDKLLMIGDALTDYRGWLRGLDDYLRQFLDLDYYRGGQCYASDLSCPGRVWRQILATSWERHGLASASQKKTLDWLMKSLDESDEDLRMETENLRMLQQQAQSAEGHMQALQAGNQLASAQAHQLMQMRAIMHAQYRATAAQALATQTNEAEQRAISERYRRPMAESSPDAHYPEFPRMKP